MNPHTEGVSPNPLVHGFVYFFQIVPHGIQVAFTAWLFQGGQGFGAGAGFAGQGAGQGGIHHFFGEYGFHMMSAAEADEFHQFSGWRLSGGEGVFHAFLGEGEVPGQVAEGGVAGDQFFPGGLGQLDRKSVV